MMNMLIIRQIEWDYRSLLGKRYLFCDLKKGARGEYADTSYGQLALAHTYGSGLEDSCENVKIC